MSQIKTPTRPVWDPLIRIGHWTLVIAFFTAYLSGDDLFNIHKWAGYVVAAYVLVRIVWGIMAAAMPGLQISCAGRGLSSGICAAS